MTGTGIVKAFDFDGRELWMRDIQKDYGRFGLNWGYGSSLLLHGDALTVTGRTMAENLDHIRPPDVDGKVIRALSQPIHRTGGLTILQGSLAPEGAVVKSAGFDEDVFEGNARVFDGERAAMCHGTCLRSASL